jgi:capsular polysaccharide biosynthesis protein
MTNEISISLLLKVLKSAWWKILIFTVVIALIAAAVTSFVIPKKYSSSVTFYVNNTSSDYEYTTASLLEAAQLLANGYIEIIKSDVMLEKINNSKS